MRNSTNMTASEKLAEGQNLLAAGNPVAARYHLMGAATRMGADRKQTRMMSPEALLNLIAQLRGRR